MNILKQIQSRSYYVLRVDPGASENHAASGLVFSRLGEKIDFIEKLGEQTLEEIFSSIPRNSNVIVLLCGDQVLTRFTQDDEGSLFDELDEEDFYFQKAISQEGWNIQSACRRSVVDPLIKMFSQKRFFLLDVTLGPVAIPLLEEHLGSEILKVGHHRFQFSAHHLKLIQEVNPSEPFTTGNQEMVVAGSSFSPDGLSMLASILHYFKEGSDIESLDGNQGESKFFRLFQRATGSILLVFFVTLLTNFLLFSRVNADLEQLTKSGENLTEKIAQIEGLKSQIKEYRNLVENNGKAPDQAFSYYLDQIAGIRPSGVWYNTLHIHPLKRKQETNKSIELDHTLITLFGEAKDPVKLNHLINSLEEMPWVTDIELRNYETSLEKQSAQFEIAIRKEK